MRRSIKNLISRIIPAPEPYILQEYEIREDGTVTGTIHSVHPTEAHRRAFVTELEKRRSTVEPGTGAFPVGEATVSELPYTLVLIQQGDRLYTYGRWVNL